MGYLRGRFAHLDELRAHARRRGHWETLRECDRFTVLRDGSPSLAAKLLFGTPHSAYRDSLRRELAGRVEFPVEYDVSLGDTSATETAPRLELSTGAFVDGDHHARLTVGQVRHRFLAVLLGERYAPIPLATLFCRIQPQERFQPETSSARIHETARIVRRWLEANRVPLRVARFAGGYYAAATAPITVRYSESAFAQHLHGDVLDSMRHAWDETPFSAMQAARLVGRAPRTVRRLLKEAVEEGILERLGRGRNVRHRFPPRSP